MKTVTLPLEEYNALRKQVDCLTYNGYWMEVKNNDYYDSTYYFILHANKETKMILDMAYKKRIEELERYIARSEKKDKPWYKFW